MRAAHDAAPRRLAENFREAYHGNRAGDDDVGQHLARTDRRELVDVTYEQQGSVIWYSLEQGLHQHHVHHRGLVYDQQIAAQRVVAISPEAATPGVRLEQAVNRPGLKSGGLAQALGSAAGRRAQHHVHVLGDQDAQDAVHEGRLAYPRTAGHDHDLRHQGQANGVGLAGCQ